MVGLRRASTWPLAHDVTLSHIDALYDGLVEGLYDDIGRFGDELAVAETILSMWISPLATSIDIDQQEDEEIGRAR